MGSQSQADRKSRFGPIAISGSGLVVVIASIFATDAFLGHPLPEYRVQDPVLGERGYIRIGEVQNGENVGPLAGVSDLGNYAQAITNTVAATSHTLIGFLIGLCALSAYVLRDISKSSDGVLWQHFALTTGFVGFTVASGYAAFKANITVLTQLAQAIIYLPGIETALALQALCLTLASACALALALTFYCNDTRRRSVPASDPLHQHQTTVSDHKTDPPDSEAPAAAEVPAGQRGAEDKG